MTADIECIVIGAGVIGLAIARQLAQSGREVLLVEAGSGIGEETSSRNSEVIHSGIYYPTGSLKAKLCVAGREQLYAYCAARHVPHRQLGKLIVATTAQQLPELNALAKRGQANGVNNLYLVDSKRAQEMEPNLRCHAALVSPSTGIIDSHALMLALQGDAESHGAQCVFRTQFQSGTVLPNGLFQLRFAGDNVLHDDTLELTANIVVNAAGLAATTVAHDLAGVPACHIPKAYLCKGSYFSLMGKSPFSRLIYPMPDSAGLGVHLTLDMGGQARFGPDTQWVDTPDYRMEPQRANSFYAAIRRYWPSLPDAALQPAYAGIRPKIAGPGMPAADFVISGPDTHGIGGLVNLFGIESPGLTSCLAVAKMVEQALAGG